MPPPKVAIVCALMQEIRPLIKDWCAVEKEYDGRRYRFFESGNVVAVCGGVGPEAARRATEAVIALYEPKLVKSVGFAGGLDPRLKAGDLLLPNRVIDARDGSSVETGAGKGTLVSFGGIATAEQKKKLAAAYAAQAVDMEAGAVAKGARARGVGFTAVKVVSDELGFDMPPMDRFVTADGRFQSVRFVVFALIRPRIWSGLLALARNTTKAAKILSGELARSIRVENSKERNPELHLIK
jgi:adenosylhomocysteine nucleosidase